MPKTRRQLSPAVIALAAIIFLTPNFSLGQPEAPPTTTERPPVSTSPATDTPPTTTSRDGDNPGTTDRPTLNLKIVNYGGPPHDRPVIHFGEDPKIPADSIPRTGDPHYWNPFHDPDGPHTYIPKKPDKPGQPYTPGGGGRTPYDSTDIPVNPPPGGGYVEIGQGWAYVKVPLPHTTTRDGGTPTHPGTTDRPWPGTYSPVESTDIGYGIDDDPYGFFGATRRRRNCDELKKKMEYLKQVMAATCTANRQHAKEASEAFTGDPKSEYNDGYAHWFTSAKVTEAVVDAETATGKALIDVALFAMGGWGGFGGRLSGLDKVFGEGIRGAESVAEVYEKIALKVLEKAGDSFAGYKAGKAGTSIAKVIDDPSKWYKAAAGGLESVVRGSIIEGLGNWMKEGAMSADLERAENFYAEFASKAMMANLDAAMYNETKKEFEALAKQATDLGCPVPTMEKCYPYTFDIKPFGQGAFKGQQGPTMSKGTADGGTNTWDMFDPKGNDAAQPSRPSFPFL